MVKTNIDAEANNVVQDIQRQYLGRVVVRFRKAPTHTNAPQRRNTLQTMAIEAREVQAAAAWEIAQEAAVSLRITDVVCMRAGAKLRPSLQTTTGEE